jgi:hypothetical protein
MREDFTMRKGRRAASGAIVITVFAVFTAAAYATNDQWFSGTLANGLGFASTGAHSIFYIQGTGNRSGFCIAKDTGIAGYDVASRAVHGTRSCAPGSGFVSRTENSACCFHGWIDNGTGFSLTVDPATYYSY